MTRSEDVIIAGIPWFTKDSYPRCLEIFDDPGDYPDTFNEWIAKAKETEKKLLRLGAKVIRAEIDPNTFPAWCAMNGFDKVDAKARSHFANLKAAESVGIRPNG